MDKNGNNKDEEDNGAECTFKPLIELKEQKVANGHGNEKLIQSIPFKTLYVFGPNVSGEKIWKERATKSEIQFYQSNENKTVRIVAREQLTMKLRLNQKIATNEEISNLTLKRKNVYSWNAIDSTIDDDEGSLSSFCIRFDDDQNCQLFAKTFNASIKQNKNPENDELKEFEACCPLQPQSPPKNNDNNIGWQLPSPPGVQPAANFSFDAVQNTSFTFASANNDNSPWSFGQSEQPLFSNPFNANPFQQNKPGEQHKENEQEKEAKPFKFAVDDDKNDAGFFVDNKDVNFGEYMSNIKSFVTSNNDDENDDDKEKEDEEDNVKEITFKPIVHLQEIDIEDGHENDNLLKEYDVSKVYRWGKDVAGVPCWKTRASKTTFGFYQNRATGKIRLVCRETMTNKLRLNQWIDSKIANIEKKNEKSIQWTAIDASIADEDNEDVVDDECKSSGFCMFAAKFNDKEVADSFVKFFKLQATNNTVIADLENEKAMKKSKVDTDEDQEDDKEESDLSGEEEENCVTLQEYDVIEIKIWNDDNWTNLIGNTKLKLTQNPENGQMNISCSKRSKLNHLIPKQVEGLKKKIDNEIQWSDDSGDNTYSAKFNDCETSNSFFEYFKAGSMNNSQIVKK